MQIARLLWLWVDVAWLTDSSSTSSSRSSSSSSGRQPNRNDASGASTTTTTTTNTTRRRSFCFPYTKDFIQKPTPRCIIHNLSHRDNNSLRYSSIDLLIQQPIRFCLHSTASQGQRQSYSDQLIARALRSWLCPFVIIFGLASGRTTLTG